MNMQASWETGLGADLGSRQTFGSSDYQVQKVSDPSFLHGIQRVWGSA